MFADLSPQPADKIIALMAAYREDPRTDKIDLGVGVYKDESGNTPVMRAVRTAEAELVAAQTTKTYTRLIGDADYIAAMQELALGDLVARDRVTGSQAPGGTGALRMLFELVRLARPTARFWISDPSWPNHAGILKHMGTPPRSYSYFDPVSRSVRFDAMMEDLKEAGPDDVVILHGCCHNPTGANLTVAQWEALAESAVSQGWLPLVDLAYLGLGDGLAEDAAGYRAMAVRVPRMMIAMSCSKNFGLYRDRAGATVVIGETPAEASMVEGTLASLNRLTYSFAPHHPAAIVARILSTPALRAEWEEELGEMRDRVNGLRHSLASALRQETNSDRFDFLAEHRGMFSLLGASSDQVEAMRADNGVYMVGDSRMNIAGLHPDQIPGFARAIIAAGV
ncbi:MAG: amino acid aminotransferase [Pseudomonadota bacterium]